MNASKNLRLKNNNNHTLVHNTHVHYIKLASRDLILYHKAVRLNADVCNYDYAANVWRFAKLVLAVLCR
jgi:hypothetical protein